MSMHPQGARAELLAAVADHSWGVRIPQLADPQSANDAAVLILFGVLDHTPAPTADAAVARDLDVLLQRRAPTLSSHPGQVSFPGGRAEPDDADVVATALREAEEETGLDPAGVEILGMLPQVSLPVSNFMVTPVLGWWASQTPVAVVDYGESAQVFRTPVHELLDPANRYMATLSRGGQTYRSPAFRVNGVIVWGFTAGILTRLFDELGWTLPWDETREIPAPI